MPSWSPSWPSSSVSPYVEISPWGFVPVGRIGLRPHHDITLFIGEHESRLSFLLRLSCVTTRESDDQRTRSASNESRATARAVAPRNGQ
jgi:hypothetical protein